MYLTTLDREFDRIVRRAFDQFALGPSAFGAASPALPMDTVRRDGEVVLRFDIPGVAPEQIEVTVDHGVLTVSATREETKTDGDQPVLRERYSGRVTRSVRLPEYLNADKIEAASGNGVLEIRIPVREEAKPRKITIGTRKELTS